MKQLCTAFQLPHGCQCIVLSAVLHTLGTSDNVSVAACLSSRRPQHVCSMQLVMAECIQQVSGETGLLTE
jgi:hypothetical protein